MSYILEALRKADAERERERGAVPDLHAQLLPGGLPDDEQAPRRGGRWAIAAALLALLVLAAWLFFAPGPDPVAVPLAPAPAPAVPGVAMAPAVPGVATAPPAVPPAPAAAPPKVPVPALRAAPPPAAAPASATARAGPTPTPTPSPAKLQPPARADAPNMPAVGARAAAGPAVPSAAAAAAQPARPGDANAVPRPGTAAPAAPGSPAASAARWPGLGELPEELRRQLPALSIGGSVYSPQAEKRMVIVNGQVFLEGATLAPELRLEQIRPKSAVFSIRGQRFEVPL